jgi:hypothetical protein
LISFIQVLKNTQKPKENEAKKIHSKGYATDEPPTNRTVSKLTAGSDMQEIL